MRNLRRNEIKDTETKKQSFDNIFFNLKCDHPLWAFTLSLGTLTYGGTFEIKRLSCGGQSIVEFYVFSVLL